MKKAVLNLLALALVSFSAFGADVDLKKSEFKWEGSKVTGKHHGKVPLKSGVVQMKDGKITGGEFVADLTAFTVTDLEGEWADKFLGHMKSGDFFEVEKYPTSKLVIKSVKGKKVTADLTVKDKTNQVTFDMTQKGNEYTGQLIFDRTKFGMIYGSGDFFKNLGDKMINNEVKVDFKFVVKK
ncbi:MAG: lipid-binding protein [Halobacteriovoraceae bacterium]|nr:lipid-binding protein [Halobacteriovoraceae bacterium]|tara:strand:+ start:11346 stop:11891 length:546 start_codon:yes stop_codon:yes gene_type:complete